MLPRIDAWRIRSAIGGGFVIQTANEQQYITGRKNEWNGSSWMGYPCDDNDRIIPYLPAIEVFPVCDNGKVVGYTFQDPRKQ